MLILGSDDVDNGFFFFYSCSASKQTLEWPQKQSCFIISATGCHLTHIRTMSSVKWSMTQEVFCYQIWIYPLTYINVLVNIRGLINTVSQCSIIQCNVPAVCRSGRVWLSWNCFISLYKYIFISVCKYKECKINLPWTTQAHKNSMHQTCIDTYEYMRFMLDSFAWSTTLYRLCSEYL